MKKCILAVVLFFITLFLCPAFSASAAQRSSDSMILDWQASKAWVDHGELLVRGTFTNKRNDLLITKLEDFTIQMMFTRADGSRYQYIGAIQKRPMLRLPAGKSKTVTLNFGPFTDDWKSWVATETYTFTYNDVSTKW